jgi:hypothetical protein
MIPDRIKPFHVGVAAEGFAAGVFAHAGFDISVQYGANQPEYDLMVTRSDRFLKVSVKGSQDGGWGLCQNYKKGNDYHQAAERWFESQSPRVIYCLVQFKDVDLGKCPRIYLATVREIADQMKSARNGHGSTILYENYNYRKGVAANCSDCLPSEWTFSRARIEELLARTT